MYETRCWKIKLKPDSMERVREWAQTINSRKAEALETLRDETVIIEAVFLDKTDDGDYLIAIMKAESFEKSAEAVKNSTHAIDEYHRRVMQGVRDEKTELELLVDLDRISEMRR
jgi:prolyl oligopeptidase PreP (S9A serine peptidase family)